MRDMNGLKLRQAKAADVDTIVALISDDPFGAKRERPGDPAYAAAFQAIEADPNNELWVIEAPDGRVVGTLQITFIPGISRIGATRAQIEAVRVAEELRGQGIGRWLFENAIARAREKGASLVQLTSEKTRTDAHGFYNSLGFEATHAGFKLTLTPNT